MESIARDLITDDGTTIAYTVFLGKEPAIVILHGLAGSSREFVPTAQSLSGRRVILIDQRGHGLSTTRPERTSREAFVSDVVAVLERESSEPADLVGQSMGAHTAMLVTSARPDLVRRLVLLEGNEGSGTPNRSAALGEYFRSWDTPFADSLAASAALGNGPLQRAWVDDLEQTADGLRPRFDPDVMQATIEAVSTPRWSEWESIEAPTLVVYAGCGMFTEEQKTNFVRRGRNVQRVDLDRASHDAHLDAFEQWSAALRSFLEVR
ncbi:alpha/beta fold hydrolase [Microbacterium sp. P05]|uniref:alpha/beta fold hydrolase n=1 Tax=Microbacterium sp. P05 TaxID=3366948 RepID=UPI003747150D